MDMMLRERRKVVASVVGRVRIEMGKYWFEVMANK